MSNLNDLLNHKIQKVLSEGEFRIVSLAAFLADVADKPFNSPFIFDDPISSLDAEYEEVCVKRIIELSKHRQVIVFTHRLSFAWLLNEYATNNNIVVDHISLVSEPWGKGQPSMPLTNTQDIDKAFNSLANQRLDNARKIYLAEGESAYLIQAKAMTSEFRILLERLVEEVLLYKIVRRFHREIQTKNKLEHLTKINKDDVLLIDGMMTKYSTYEHSQPSELPLPMVKADALKEDFVKIVDWIKEFKSRKAA